MNRAVCRSAATSAWWLRRLGWCLDLRRFFASMIVTVVALLALGVEPVSVDRSSADRTGTRYIEDDEYPSLVETTVLSHGLGDVAPEEWSTETLDFLGL